MKASLQLKLSQQLALTPQLQQAIKLLQLSTLELNQEIERYLLENPLLEREDEDQAQNYTSSGESTSPAPSQEASEESRGEQENEGAREESLSSSDLDEDRWISDSGSYSGSGSGGGDDDDGDAQDIHAAEISLREHLCGQLGLTQLSDHDRSLVRFLVEALDEDGYLTTSLDELYATLPEELDIEPEELEIALHHLQHFDPTGIGARNPQECLALQLECIDAGPVRDLALVIVRQHLELLAARDFIKLRKLTNADDDQLRAAQSLITGLNPRPGARYAPDEARYITPDVLVRKVRGHWTATINPDAFPKLRVNRLYASILQGQRRGDGGMSGQLQEARWLIKNVQQRFDTIQRVSQAIVDRQRQFFEHGEVAMRPLVLREIADLIGLHESTVSRVTTQKYMATPRGIFELKYFFGSHVATDTGGACSATAIRALIRQLIGAEDGKKPLSDSQISEILGQQGIVVARRTVAKYREALNIPPVNLRKTL
jgi:RNA polymerase sigma-54 factor